MQSMSGPVRRNYRSAWFFLHVCLHVPEGVTGRRRKVRAHDSTRCLLTLWP